MSAQSKPVSLLRFKHVSQRTGLSRAELYRRIAKGDFPKPEIRLGPSAIAWDSRVIDSWVEEQISKARSKDNASQFARVGT